MNSLSRAITPFRHIGPPILTPCLQLGLNPFMSREQVRFGSMKVKRIQKKQPLERNKIWRRVKGTKLQPRKPRRMTARQQADPDKYIRFEEVEDPYGEKQTVTIKVSQRLSRLI
jgi:hypothetical protein